LKTTLSQMRYFPPFATCFPVHCLRTVLKYDSV
jgi:hypothetical protein